MHCNMYCKGFSVANVVWELALFALLRCRLSILMDVVLSFISFVSVVNVVFIVMCFVKAFVPAKLSRC